VLGLLLMLSLLSTASNPSVHDRPIECRYQLCKLLRAVGKQENCSMPPHSTYFWVYNENRSFNHILTRTADAAPPAETKSVGPNRAASIDTLTRFCSVSLTISIITKPILQLFDLIWQ
jgi:hypothetical protein